MISLLQNGADQVEERAFTLDDVRNAREVFTSSAGAMIAPVLSLDGDSIGEGQPGPVTRAIQAAYYQFIGADLAALDWL